MPFIATDPPLYASLAFVLHVGFVLFCIPWVLTTKKDGTSAVAWCLVVILLPWFGPLLFWAFGYSYLYRPLRRRRKHSSAFRATHPPQLLEATEGASTIRNDGTYDNLGSVATHFDAFPVTQHNRVTLFSDTHHAFESLLEAIAAARQHVHLEFFILRQDKTAQRFFDLLTKKAREGVEVRLLYDAMGCVHLKQRVLDPLRQAGGRTSVFLPLNPIRSRLRINLRNHRKIAVIDGRVAFTGGMNIGDEYLGEGPYFAYWRDEFFKVEGPAVAGLQRVFVQDWDFACAEPLPQEHYFPKCERLGDTAVQVIASGPDQQINSIRQMYIAAMNSARKRLWIASPYFVPDNSMLDALHLARARDVDVRVLCLMRPDHYVSFYAGRYYWDDMLAVGVGIYQYCKGMMHAKVLMVDDRWSMVGSANLDNRSLRLNFEAGCIFHDEAIAIALEQAFERDLADSIQLTPEAFAKRPLVSRVGENICRLLSPIL